MLKITSNTTNTPSQSQAPTKLQITTETKMGERILRQQMRSENFEDTSSFAAAQNPQSACKQPKHVAGYGNNVLFSGVGKAGQTIPDFARSGAQLMSGDVKEVR